MAMKKTLIAFILTAISLTTILTPAYAFWNQTTVEEKITITIGDWEVVRDWQPNIVYQMGDVVFHNGQYWIRTSNAGNRIEPSDRPPGRNFWQIHN